MWLSTVGCIITLALGILATPVISVAQPSAKVSRLGYLGISSPADEAPLTNAFQQGLRDLGWVEGQNITMEYRWAEGQRARLPELAAELVQLKVDLIVTWTTPGAQAAKQATSAIPIVFATGGDPIRAGLVASLARPAGNITGLSHLAGEGLSGKRLELLKESMPQVSRVAVLWDAPISPEGIARGLQVGAQALGVRLQALQVRSPQEIAEAFAAMTRERAEALFVWETASTTTHRQIIVDLAAKHGLPAMYGSREFVDAGGLMSYATSFPDLFRRAASYVDRILKGAKPADIPVEQPMKFELVINLKTAKALGLTIPPTLLFQADEVIR